jgi:phenylacetate-CoA ligase
VRRRIPISLWLGTQGCPRDAASLRDLQERRLRQLLDFAVRHSVYYRDLGSPGRRPSLSDFPLLTRETLRDRARDIATVPLETPGLRMQSTSGWSGMPLRLPTDRGEMLFDALLWLAIYRFHGLRAWHHQVKFAQAGMNPDDRAIRHAWLFRRRYAPALSSPEEKVRLLREVRPESVVGWASLLGEVALQLERENARLRIPLIFSVSDMLWPPLRVRIEERLGGRVADTYGSVETGPIAFECRQRRGYHVRSDFVIVELLDDADRPARAGRVVCTVLWRRVAPLIRYELGDVAEWAEGPCPCGSPLPRLARLHGRRQDLWKLPSGEWISSGSVEEALIDYVPGIRAFQFIREAEDRVRLQLVTTGEFPTEAERAMTQCFRRRFGDVLALVVERVEAIHKRPGEKFTPFVDRTARRE